MVVIYLLISVILIIYLSTKLKIHPFIALFIVALLYGFFAGMSLDLIISSINQGFGDTLGKIGLIIVLGIIIGSFLENSGAAPAGAGSRARRKRRSTRRRVCLPSAKASAARAPRRAWRRSRWRSCR